MSAPRSLVATLVVALFALVAACSAGPTEAPVTPVMPPAAPLPALTLGIQTSPAMAVPMVAEDLGLFDAEGVNVELKEFTAGKFALQAALGGSVDLAVAGEVPVGLAAMQGNGLKVFTQVVARTNNEVRVVARRDGALTDPVAWFGAHKRKLATSLGGGPEFFTWSYLKHLGVKPDQVEIVAQKPEDMPAALATGSVDAVAIFDPPAFLAERQLGAEGITFPDAGVYSELYVLVATPASASAHADAIKAMVRALVKAGAAIQADPARAQAVVQKYTHLDAAVVAGVWGSFEFRPALTPQLLDFWTRQGAWAQETGKLAPGATLPDFRALIDAEALRAASPADVGI